MGCDNPSHEFIILINYWINQILYLIIYVFRVYLYLFNLLSHSMILNSIVLCYHRKCYKWMSTLTHISLQVKDFVSVTAVSSPKLYRVGVKQVRTIECVSTSSTCVFTEKWNTVQYLLISKVLYINIQITDHHLIRLCESHSC